MARFSLDKGTSGSKRKKCSNDEEEDLKKKACGRSEGATSEAGEEEEAEEEEEEAEAGYDVEDDEVDTMEDRGVLGGNKDGEFNFRIDPDVLDCSICFELLRPPIFQCRNGHIACSSCCPKLENKCHFCSQPIGRRRCIALEKIIESIMCPCPYANYGCGAILSLVRKASHEEVCSHAPLFCPISNCTFSGSKSLLFTHAIHKHSSISKSFSYDKSFIVSFEKQQPFMVLLGEDDRFFLLNSHDTYSGNMLSVICMASNSPDCEFSYELNVYKAGGSSLRLKTSAEKVRKWNEVHPCKTFLVVPDGFYISTVARLHVTVCIFKKSIGVPM